MTQIIIKRSREDRDPSSRLRPGEWRCSQCHRLLGLVQADRLHLRFSRQHEYIAALPATCTCRRCGSMNRLDRG
jgi:RNase P subunit RPR2